MAGHDKADTVTTLLSVTDRSLRGDVMLTQAAQNHIELPGTNGAMRRRWPQHRYRQVTWRM